MLEIDGSFGEGGGQILRTSLALSVITGEPFRIYHLRAGRDRPGLQRQHLTAVKAAAAISGASLRGAEVGSRELTFTPRAVAAGEYTFDIGSAGSSTLVLQTVLPPLMMAGGTSRVVLQGGTHNPNAPPFDFFSRSFLPLVGQIGPRISAHLDRPGFYPVGGGQVSVSIEPAQEFHRLELLQRGPVVHKRVRAVVARLPRHIAEREAATLGRLLDWDEKFLEIEVWTSRGPGNVVLVEISTASVTEVFTGFGERGVRAEVVAEGVAAEAADYLAADVPVGPHLADQLILPLALGAGGAYITSKPTLHTTTNIEVVRRFLDVPISIEELSAGNWIVRVK
jgi:RNA 3'-terminal phosphate cyclase (ATP)